MKNSMKLLLGMSASLFVLAACAPKSGDDKQSVQAQSSGEIEKPAEKNLAERIHDKALIIDSHIDIELEDMAKDLDPWGSGKTVNSLDRMEKGGLDGAFFIVYTAQGSLDEAGIKKAREIAETRYKSIMRAVEKYPDRIGLAKTPGAAKALHAQGKRIAFIGMENAYPLGNSVDDVKFWAERGVRYMGITHMGHNQFADSSNPKYSAGDKKEKWGGLSALGEKLIGELNKNGIMVDVSHTAKSTMMQAAALSKTPIIASHSGVMGVAKNARNLDDEQLQALAKSGGVIQIVAYGGYLKELTPEQKQLQTKVRKELGLEDDMAFLTMDEKTEAIYDEKMQAAKKLAPPANVSDLVDHIDYVVKLIGVDHVGISSDFDGGGKIVGWMDPSETKNITRELVKRGYSEEDIDKILGGNILRVLAQVEAYAKTQH